MKAKVLTVHWHQENQPIYSADFQPIGPSVQQPGHELSSRLATAGGDNNIRIWRLQYGEDGMVSGVQYLATLSKHSQAVNVVRFDPKGITLASASDDGTVLLWALQDAKSVHGNSKYDGTEESDSEIWKLRHACRGGGQSSSEVYDLAWSPDSQYIIAGQVNNVARIYNASNGQCIRELVEHSHYVQGVAWDPLNEYLATQSSDRSVHIYTLRTKEGKYTLSNSTYKISSPFKISKADLPTVRKIDIEGPTGSNVGNSTNTIVSGNSNSNISTTTTATIKPSNIPLQAPTSNTSTNPIAYSTASPPDTPRSTGSMNPPPTSTSRTHSRKSSFSSLNRPESPSPVFPLPAVRQIGSPVIPAASLVGSISSSLSLNGGNFPTPSSTSSSPSLPTAQLATTTSSCSTPTTPLMRSSMLYHNETFTSFFRRLTFSPDGSLLFTPSGLFKYTVKQSDGLGMGGGTSSSSEETTNTVYIYTRAGFNRPPVAHLPGLNKPSLAVKCSPILYKLRDTASKTKQIKLTREGKSTIYDNEQETNEKQHLDSPVFNLKYRIIYAVATQDSVIVYDTQQKHPICIASNLHYATFTDLAWTPDGNTLLMTSTDGFCSTLSFENGELGEVYNQNHLLTDTGISGSSGNSGSVSNPTNVTNITTPSTTTPSTTATSTYAPASSPLPDPSLIPVMSHVPSISVTGSPISISTPPAESPLTQPLTSPAKRPLQLSSTPSSTSTSTSTSSTPSTATTTAATAATTASSTAKKQRRIAPTLISDNTS